MPLISHEIPKHLFPYHDLINDYPYVLAHLLLEDEHGKPVDADYAKFYKRKLEKSYFSILDNSAFELGESIDLNDLLDLARRYKPTHVVIPDKVNDYQGTLNKFIDFKNVISVLDSKSEFKYIGVVQGNTFREISKMIEAYLSYGKVSLIALPFDLVPESEYVTVRYRFFKWYRTYIGQNNLKLLTNKIHLLGCYNPIEFELFRDSGFEELIHSIDTSSPIINGWEGNLFYDNGLFGPKPKAKLAENLNIVLSPMQQENIVHNVNKFREYVNW